MDEATEKAANDRLMQYCKETLETIQQRELETKRPKQFIEYTDAAACNQQHLSNFDQENVIQLAILKWGRKILQHLAINTPIKIQDLLGLYLLIHVEVPFTNKEMPPMKYAMIETVDLFEKGNLTLPIATRLLIAGLQNTIYEQSLLEPINSEIKRLFRALTNATSGISLPYSKANVQIKN